MTLPLQKPGSKHHQTLSVNSVTSFNSAPEPSTPPDYNSSSIWNNSHTPAGAHDDTGKLDSDASFLNQIGTGYNHKRQSSTSLLQIQQSSASLNSPINFNSFEAKFNNISLKHPHSLLIESPYLDTVGQLPASYMNTPTAPLTVNSAAGIETPGSTVFNLDVFKPSASPSTVGSVPPISKKSSTSNASPSPQLALPSILGGKKYDKDSINKLNSIPFESLTGEIVNLSKDQYGCRFLQKKIDENSAVNFEVIFGEIHSKIYELIIDPFGNYLIQKLISLCDEAKLNTMVENLSLNLFQISINQHGTRALQRLIEFLDTEYQYSLIIAGLSSYVIDLIKDLNGNHVIQKCLNKLTTTNCQFIYEAIAGNIVVVATHKHGCCVLQKCLNHIDNEAQLIPLASEIINHSSNLIKDQFGNYVIQYLLSLNKFEATVGIYHRIKHSMDDLCTQKFSSNVIEKLLKICKNNEYGDNNVADDMICLFRQLQSSVPPSDFPAIQNFKQLKNHLAYQILNNGNLNKFVNDPFGNYVVQTLIDVVPIEYQSAIIQQFFVNCKILTPFGKRIQSKINTILNTSLLNMNNNGEFQFKNDNGSNPAYTKEYFAQRGYGNATPLPSEPYHSYQRPPPFANQQSPMNSLNSKGFQPFISHTNENQNLMNTPRTMPPQHGQQSFYLQSPQPFHQYSMYSNGVDSFHQTQPPHQVHGGDLTNTRTGRLVHSDADQHQPVHYQVPFNGGGFQGGIVKQGWCKDRPTGLPVISQRPSYPPYSHIYNQKTHSHAHDGNSFQNSTGGYHKMSNFQNQGF